MPRIYYEIEKPDVSRIPAQQAIAKLFTTDDYQKYLVPTESPIYLYWDKVKYKPRPETMSAEEFWVAVKRYRFSRLKRSEVISDVRGRPFKWQMILGMDEFLHNVDLSLCGELVTAPSNYAGSKQWSISRGVMEESISSAQLEGAATTRRVAKRMLIEKRKPRNKSEQMILNNYRAMIDVEERLKDEKLTLESLFELHATLTKDTVEDDEIGRLRRDKDDIIVEEKRTNTILHRAPSESFLKHEIDRLLDYANDDLSDREFVHPLIKAILLHFWVGYLHPFTDGNGRLARCMFFWYMIRKGYWAFSFLPLSKAIKSSPAQYRDAYVYTEQDDNDLTYFIDYNLRKIKQAQNDLAKYVDRKRKENKQMQLIARNEYDLNDRQIQVLRYLAKNPSGTTTIKAHSELFDIGRLTARKDLLGLQEVGLVKSRKVGRERPFSATEKAERLLSGLT